MASATGMAATPDTPRAALVVIGDEILSGSVVDTNTPWLAKLLHRLEGKGPRDPILCFLENGRGSGTEGLH